jgi:hypothetical protein
MSCGKDSPPYCEAQQKKVTDLLQQIKDYQEARTASGFSWLASQATLVTKYGVQGTPGALDIFKLNQQLESAQADLAECRLSHGLAELGTVGKLASMVTSSVYKFFSS